MPSIEQVLWFIESEQDANLDLGSVAAHAGLSPFALSRLFSLATGWSVMRYPPDPGGPCPGRRHAGHPAGGAGCGLWLP